jgi:hypothetical protein
LNDVVRHAVELQAFQSADGMILENQGYVKAVEKDINGTKGNKTDKLLKEITDTLSSLQKEVWSLKDSQARRTSF